MEIYIGIILAFHLILGIYFWKGFKKAGQHSWEPFIPFYGVIRFLRVIHRPWWWFLGVYIPVVGNIFIVVMLYEWLHVFGYRKKRYTLISVLTFGLYAAYVTYLPQTVYVGKDNTVIRKNVSRWVPDILFPVVLATLVHTYFLQPFVIPTSSLEKTLLVGDFLIVGKFNYGARVPTTPFALPMVHDTIYLTKIRSYLSYPQLPYLRLPAIEKVKRNDITVFNWPVDTVRYFRDRSGIHVDKPLDKKSNYVKRTVAVAGDTLSIKDGVLYINSKPSLYPKSTKLQYSYWVKLKPNVGVLTPEYMYQKFNITDPFFQVEPQLYLFTSLTDEVASQLKSNPNIEEVKKRLEPEGKYKSEIFPHSPNYAWNEDNMGPIEVPYKGKTQALTVENLPLYKRIIQDYEGNTLNVEGNVIYINGIPTTSYTFKQDYYWMMGDNRHNSEDSRYWGFVPEDHIIGKPLIVWMSFDKNASGFDKIRWDRLFTVVNTDTEKPVSYLRYVIALIVIYIVTRKIIKRKKR